MKNILLLASKSFSRQMLLKQAFIPFNVIDQFSDESGVCRVTNSLEDAVKSIAVQKMQHVQMPQGQENEVAFVLTADTMGVDFQGKICGKPTSKTEAIEMLKNYRLGAETCTAFCLEKKIWKVDGWQTEKQIVDLAKANYIFDVPDNELEEYFQMSIKAGINFMNVSGAVAIEEFGAQFLKTLNGSYTAVVGLPMFELRKALRFASFF